MIHAYNLYYLNNITMNEPDLFSLRAGGFNRSTVSADRGSENYDVQTITKKIQEQTKTIEDEIKKVADILKRQEENPV